MNKLRNWDFAENLTGHEAAALILGLDPLKDDCAIAEPVLRRMRADYEAALFAYQTEVWWDEAMKGETSYFDGLYSYEDDPLAPTHLLSWRMTAFIFDSVDYDHGVGPSRTRNALFELAEQRFQRWLFNDLLNGFDHQLFERYELQRWLTDSGLSSEYQFSTPNTIGTGDVHPEKGTLYGPSKRSDLITPAIEHAQTLCKNPLRVQEVWNQLGHLARKKYPPLIGIDETGIQYLDAKESFKTLSFTALSMRLYRARKQSLTNEK